VARVKEVFYKALAVLYRYCDEVAVIDYPDKIERRSVDVVARTRDGRVMLLKITDDASELPRSELLELKGLAATLGFPAGIVAERMGGRELAPYVAYERGGIPVISIESLEEYLRGGGGLYAYQARDTLRARIDGDAMRRARESLGLSLGDVASFIGVSRKMVYEYERGVADPTLDKAEKLARLLGEEVIEPIDPFKEPPEEPAGQPPYDERGEERLARILEERGARVFHAKKTAVDLTAVKRESRIVIAYHHKREPLSRLLDRVDNLLRFSRVAGSRPVAVVESRSAERELMGMGDIRVVRRDRRVRPDEVLGEEAPNNG